MAGQTRITVAKSAGFCPGVKAAIDKVLELAKSRRRTIYTLGPLIHNKQVLETLKAQNIHAVKSASEIKEKGAILVIRAHGITPAEEAAIRALDLEVVDATCPLVKRVQKNISEYAGKGYETVIVGDADHAEVVGLMGYAEGRGRVISGPGEAAALPMMGKTNIVAQTTQEGDVFAETAKAVSGKASEPVISDTICAPTKQRQAETIEFAKTSDLVIVVGGKNSANTARLFQICERLAKKAVHIENEDELRKEHFRNVSSVFITAGASTPTWMIEKVLERAGELSSGKSRSPLELLSLIWKLAVTGSLFTALAAVSLTLVCMKLEGTPVSPALLLMAGLFAFSQHLSHRSQEKSAAPDHARKLLFVKHRGRTRTAALAAGALAIFLSAWAGPLVFLATAFLWAAGLLYPHKLPAGLRDLGTFPASKDIVTATGWAFICAAAPALWHTGTLGDSSLLAAFFAFLLVFIRSVLFGVSNAHGDMITGKENLYKAAGPALTYLILFVIFLLLAVTLVLLKSMSWKPDLAAALLTGMLYYLGLLLYFYFGRPPGRIASETLIDLQFLLLAALAFRA